MATLWRFQGGAYAPLGRFQNSAQQDDKINADTQNAGTQLKSPFCVGYPITM